MGLRPPGIHFTCVWSLQPIFLREMPSPTWQQIDGTVNQGTLLRCQNKHLSQPQLIQLCLPRPLNVWSKGGGEDKRKEKERNGKKKEEGRREVAVGKNRKKGGRDGGIRGKERIQPGSSSLTSRLPHLSTFSCSLQPTWVNMMTNDQLQTDVLRAVGFQEDCVGPQSQKSESFP